MSLHNTPLRSDIKRLVSQAAFPPLDPREIQLNLSQGTVQPAQSQEVIEILYDVYSLTQPEVNHFIQRVGQQLRILRDSKHENIVRFLGWMLPEDTSSLRVDAVSMKYEGGEVMTFLRTQEDKSHRQKLARTLVFGVSKGLAHLHFKGIVHGNLNPRKIFVDCTPEGPVPRIGGFDLSYSLRETPILPKAEHRTSRFIRYTPPELLIRDGIECDMGGDIWSFACTSLEILRGEPPYKATWDDLLVPRVAMKHVSPYEWADSDDVERVLMGCLEYEPDRRPAIDEVDARLKQAATGELSFPIHADIKRELMQEDERNLTGKIQSEQLLALEGRFSSPYKGTYKGKPVCIQQINILDPRALSNSMRALKRQIRLWRRLIHANIERLHGWVLSAGTEPVISLISAWYAHRNVTEYLCQHPDTNRRKMVYDIAQGLGYLHSKEIVHGNIKPENVVIGNEGNPRLRGFQFSYDRLDQLLPPDIHDGLSPRFVSPEFLNGLTIIPDQGSDVWAFGCVTVEILIGEPPYSCLPDVKVPIIAANPRRPYDWGDLDEFESAIAKCFAYPPDNRITVNDAGDILESWLAAEATSESPDISNDVNGHQRSPNYRSGFSSLRENSDPMLITGVTSSTTLSSHVAHVVSREHLASLSVDLDVASPELKLPPTRPSDSEKKPRELSGLYPTPPLLTRTDTYTMDHKNKRKRSSTEFEPRTPKRPSTILSVSNQEQSSALSSLLHLPQLDFTSWLAPDFGFHDWHSEPYVGIHGAAGTSGDSALNSVTTLLGPSHSHSDPYTPPPSRQALPTDLLTLQTPTPDDTPHHHVPPWSLLGDRRLWPSGRSSISHSSTRVSESPVPISFVHSARLLSPPSAPSLPETAYASPNPWTPYDNRARVRTQLENAGMNFPVPPVSEPTPSSSVGPSDGIEGSIISTTRLILHTASIALKFSPISFLPKIPDLLLTLLQVYESVTGNNEALKRLNDDVQNVYSIMLRPLQLWTGPVPPQISFLVNQLHLALEDQVKKIKSPMSQNQNLFRKISTADSLTQSINDVRMHISVALSRFATAATTLNLLNTIQASVDYELSKLPRADAEWYRVKSKSECPETTRDQTRSSILNRLRDPENRFVWLRGSPGTGKTVISMGVASTLDKQHTLASSFFWDKNQRGTGLDSIERFPSTLARQLAAFNAEYKSLLIRQLRESASFSSIGGSAAEKEMAAWIINPMRELGGVLSSGKGRPVIVLDGLDECGNPEVLVSLMRLVLLLDKLPPMFAILVSCRPEPQVISAWAQANPHLSIAHEDMDQMAEDENFHTIRCMVENGLQDCIMESPWKPTEKDLDGFASACRGLPLIASTRIRDVVLQIECGSVLETEFDYYRNLIDAPQDLNWEYLRIMRRAYLQQRPEIDPHITEKYREVVGMMVVPRWAFGVYGISQLLGMFSEHEVRAILKPISSIVDMPSTNEMPVKFYHATVKEFITGIPIGKGEDKVFFINDKNGYSIGLRLLRFVNGAIKRNELGLPTELPLGDEKKWESKSKTSKPKHVDYALAHLFRHLNPSLLFSQESNGLQREFEQFWTQNLFSFFSAGSEADVPRVWNQFKNHKSKSISVVRAARDIFKWRTRPDVYRSVLPFTPTSSLVYELYGHLSDPVRVFSVSGKFAGGLIPLSDDAHSARRVMEAELTKLPGAVDEQQKEGIDYGAEFINDSVRNGIVTCAALSRDGHLVALGFGSGIIEVADINNQATICRFQSDSSYPPVWIEFIHSSNAYIATEDTQGNVTIFSHEMPMVKLGILPSTTHPPVTTVSGDGSFIARVPSNSEGDWYETTALLRVSGNSFIQLLMPPSTTQSLKPSSLPLRHTLGFSPGGRYFSAYDKNGAFIWSTDSGELITRFGMGGFDKWIINVGIAPSCSYSTPSPIFLQHSVPLIPEDVSRAQTSVSDESWLKCPFYDLSPAMGDGSTRNDVYSSAIGRTPLLLPGRTPSALPAIWFNGRSELILPLEYSPIAQTSHHTTRVEETDEMVVDNIDDVPYRPQARDTSSILAQRPKETPIAVGRDPWYGDRVLGEDNLDLFYLPRASKDGTRFLVQGRSKAPIVVDISQVV